MTTFPRRYVTVKPEDYPDLSLRLWANPTGAHLRDLFSVGYRDQAARIAELEACRLRQQSRGRLGLALVASYDGARVEAYGHTFDFSSPAAAVDTILADEVPEDLRYWLLNAPVQIPQVDIDRLGKSWASSFAPGKA